MKSSYGGRLNAHYHAMGLVLSRFNQLERVFRIKLAGYLGCDEEITGYLYDAMAENSVREVANMATKASKLPEEVKQLLYAFTGAFGKCAQNRNCVAHSWIRDADEEEGGGREATLLKWTRKTFNKDHRYSASLAELRRVADETRMTAWFGVDIYWYICANHKDCFPKLAEVTLPDGLEAPQSPPRRPPEPFLLPSPPLPLP